MKSEEILELVKRLERIRGPELSATAVYELPTLLHIAQATLQTARELGWRGLEET